MEDRIVTLAAKIVAAHMANNVVPEGRLPTLIREVHQALSAPQQVPPPNARNLANLRMAKFDVSEVAMECLELVRRSAESRGLVLSIAVAPGTRRELTADPEWLRLIVMNLLKNAVKVTREGGIEVRLCPMTDGSTTRIAITDTGPGTSSGQRRRVFNTIQQLVEPPMIHTERMTLGVALSAKVVNLSGGRLGHEDNPGGGSTFWLDLPLDAIKTKLSVETPQPPTPVAQSVEQSHRPLKILIVDDSPVSRDLATAILEKAGHKVTCANGAREAIAVAETTNFDLILMDVRMPSMDGVQATRRIRSLKGASGLVPILAVTAQDSIEHIERCRLAGMDGHITKPYTPATLQAIILRAAIAKQAYLGEIKWLGSEPAV